MAVSETQHISRLDRAVLIVILVLLLLLGATILLGDRVGVQVTQIAPLAEAHSTSSIMIRFNEAMDHDSVTSRFRAEPALEGSFSWSGMSLSFQPREALHPGATYTISLEAGALSETGRALLSEYRYSFTVARPRVAYLYPANGNPTNVWIVDPADPENPQQITHSPTGIYDYGVSPDGSRIAFSENNLNGGGSDIKLIDLQSGALEQLTNCQRAACMTPVWRPDGKMIAYTRAEDDEQFGSSPQRVWLIDLSSTPATTRPLFQQSQILGYDVQWSADGTRLALVDRGSVAILIYDFATDNIVSVSSQAGDLGALSPDGTRLVYPDLAPDLSGALMNKLRMLMVDTGEFAAISAEDEPVNDQRALWNPDNRRIAIARQDAREGRTIQIVLYDTESEQFTPLTSEMRYSNLLFWWDPTGTEMVVQRFPELDENLQPYSSSGRGEEANITRAAPLPEIWTLDVTTGAGQKLVTNAFLPHWVP